MNKNNNIKNILLLGVGIISLLFSGCEMDLEENSWGAVEGKSYFSDIAALDAGISGLYGTWHRSTWGLDVHSAYTGADDLTSRNQGNKWVFVEGDQLALSGGNTKLLAIWKGYYQVIYECNNFIELAKPDNASEVELNAYLADAHFLRGLMYFELANIFGDIPLKLSTEIDHTLQNSFYEEVMEVVIKDFEFAEKWAINKERDTPGSVQAQKMNGRASKTAAKAYLAKAYMMLSGWPIRENNWELVEAYTKEIIDAGAYSLLDDYAHNWGNVASANIVPFSAASAKNNVAWKGNKESIFAHQARFDSWPINTMSRSYGRFWRDWMDMFVENHFANEFPEGYRKTYTLAYDDKWQYAGFTAWPFEDNEGASETWPSHPSMMKFQFGTIKETDFRTWCGLGQNKKPEEKNYDPTPTPDTYLGYEHVMNSSNDMPLMRYAEVLLMYAEACARQNKAGVNPTAIEALNMVRRRAYGRGNARMGSIQKNLDPEFWRNTEPSVDFPQANDKDLITEIIDERAWEFVAEPGGNRWFDLVRTQTLGGALKTRGDMELALKGDPNDPSVYRAPIPSTESQYNPNIK